MTGFVSGIDGLVRLGMTVFGALFWDIPLAMKRMTRAVLAEVILAYCRGRRGALALAPLTEARVRKIRVLTTTPPGDPGSSPG